MDKPPIPPALSGAVARQAKQPLKRVTARVVTDVPGVRIALEVPACSFCGSEIVGPPQKRYCSTTCRVKAHRERVKGGLVECSACGGTGRVRG